MPKVLFSDNDFPDIAQEREIFAAAGVELVVAQCRTEDEVIASARGCRAILLQYAPITARVVAALPQLGVSTTSGSKWRDRQYKFRIALGPLTLGQYCGFLPGGPAWLALREWVQHYAGLDLRWDVVPILAAAEVPEPRLGRQVRLGVTTWIGRAAQPRDRRDLRLRPETSFLPRHGVRHA